MYTTDMYTITHLNLGTKLIYEHRDISKKRIANLYPSCAEIDVCEPKRR